MILPGLSIEHLLAGQNGLHVAVFADQIAVNPQELHMQTLELVCVPARTIADGEDYKRYHESLFDILSLSHGS
jgi:hypothetical protein